MDRKYQLRIATPQDTKKAEDFLSRSFFVDEPLNLETGLSVDYENGKRDAYIESYCTKVIPEGCSLVAVSEDNEIVGISLNGVVRRSDEGRDSDDHLNEKFMKVINFLKTSDEKVDIFNKYRKLNSFLEMKIISVHLDWRGLGICKKLFKVSTDVAREKGLQLVKVDCTSNITANVAEKLGFERILYVKYADYFEGDAAEPVFNPPPPHDGLQVYVYKIADVQ